MADARAYPVPDPGGSDPRFTHGLLGELAELLQRHGYADVHTMQGQDWVDLQQALYRFLYGGETR